MKNIIFLLVFLLVSSPACFSQLNQDTIPNKVQNKNQLSDLSVKKPRLKDPLTAGVLSFIVPGTGQFYNEEPVNGAIRMGIALTSLVLVFVSDPIDIHFDVGGSVQRETKGDGGTLKIVSALAYTVNWILAIVDASYSASYYNRKVLKEWNEKKLKMGFYYDNKPGIKVSFTL